MNDQPRVIEVGPLKPALASVTSSLKYLGEPSRAKFYADILPKLESIKIGGRRMIVVASMDRLIAAGLIPPKAA
jgi:hypothetical protein